MSEMRRLRGTSLLVGVSVALIVVSASAGENVWTGRVLPMEEIRYFVEQADEASLMLLDPEEGIANHPDWRTRYTRQVMGFGARTESRTLTAEDRDVVKRLLGSESSYRDEDTDCEIAGDAALLLRGDGGELLVLLELWCGRIWVRAESSLGGSFRSSIDPIRSRLLEVVASYFPDDEYLADLLRKGRQRERKD